MADMQELISRLEAAEMGSRELDAAICIALNYVGAHQDFTPENLRLADDADEDDSWLDYEVAGDDCTDTTPRLTTSLDAALALAERALPGWSWCVQRLGIIYEANMTLPTGAFLISADEEIYGLGKTPALSLCIAILKAKAQGEGG